MFSVGCNPYIQSKTLIPILATYIFQIKKFNCWRSLWRCCLLVLPLCSWYVDDLGCKLTYLKSWLSGNAVYRDLKGIYKEVFTLGLYGSHSERGPCATFPVWDAPPKARGSVLQGRLTQSKQAESLWIYFNLKLFMVLFARYLRISKEENIPHFRLELGILCK